jgi:hypothetical protein
MRSEKIDLTQCPPIGDWHTIPEFAKRNPQFPEVRLRWMLRAKKPERHRACRAQIWEGNPHIREYFGEVDRVGPGRVVKPAFVKLQSTVAAALASLEAMREGGDFSDRQRRHVEAALNALDEIVEELELIERGEER